MAEVHYRNAHKGKTIIPVRNPKSLCFTQVLPAKQIRPVVHFCHEPFPLLFPFLEVTVFKPFVPFIPSAKKFCTEFRSGRRIPFDHGDVVIVTVLRMLCPQSVQVNFVIHFIL